MKLELEPYPKAEIVHYASQNLIVSSHANVIRLDYGSRQESVTIPQDGWKRFVMPFRKARRAARLDKCNVVPIFEKGQDDVSAMVVIRQGFVYHVSVPNTVITRTLNLKQCRNVLHQSICTTTSGNLFFGEYGRNTPRERVPVYRSTDKGRSWEVIYEFSAGSIRHVHGCYWDPYTERIWTCTGDFERENKILSADENFIDVVSYGDGSQTWRTCYPMFFPDYIIWAMDSQLETSYLCKLDRATGKLTRHQDFPGPIWYAKELSDGLFVLATANEIGEGVKDEFCHVFASRDALTWQEVLSMPHDGWPKGYFKFGVIGFADGVQSSDCFYLFAEAIKSMDGRAYRCKLVDTL